MIIITIIIILYYYYTTYRFVRDRTFELIADYCDQFTGMIPIGFVLGFFVTTIVGRWWNQFNAIPWPTNVALLVSANLQVYGTVIVETLI